MAVSIATSRTISGDTFYKNKDFDISFAVVSSVVSDTCLYFGNSTYGVLPYVDASAYRFRASSNVITTTGSLGTLSVDVVALNPVTVTSATAASYLSVVGVAADPSQNVYFAVPNQNRIFQLDPSGTVSVFAGDGTAGDTNGPRLTARFRQPAGLATDGSGTFYVTDQYRVRKIAPDGTVSTLAGSTTSAFLDASGTDARFVGPGAIVIRPDGGLLVSDADAHRIRAVETDATVTTYAGTGVQGFLDASLGGSRFAFPYGMVYDAVGTLYIADQYNHRIRAVSNGSTSVTTYAGNGVDSNSYGPRLSSALSRPANLARDPVTGTIYVSSFERHDIRKLTSTTLSAFAGTWATNGLVNGYGPSAKFWGPQGMAVVGSNLYVADFYNSLLRTVTTFPDVRPSVPRIPTSGTIIATSNYPITINSRIDVCWTSVGGVLPLFKFEPFSNSFTANQCGGGIYGTNDVLSYTAASSTELIGYLSGAGTSNVLFRAVNGPSVAYTYPLTLAVNATSNGTVVDTVSTSVTIGTARLIYTPCNANLVFYRNEPSSAPVFSLVSSDANIIYSATSLPTGLSFTRTGARSFALTGTPTVQTVANTYTILAFDTSSRTYATQVSMVVNPERLILDVSGSLAQTGLTSTAPIEPITFTARFAPYGSDRTMRYTWSPPPPLGLTFRNRDGGAIAGSSYTVNSTDDVSFTMTLDGTITESQLRSFAFTNTSNYTITLTGTRTFPLPSLSPSLPRTISLAFGETIFFTSNVPPLFVGLNVNSDPSSTYFYAAKTYFPFPVDTSITNITVTDGFLPDGLTGSFVMSNQRFEITGTPVTAATYPFTLTATNGAGNTANLSVAPTIRNDSVTITALSDSCFNFIQHRNLSNAKTGFYPYPIRYSVASESGCNVTVTGTNLPAGVVLISNAGTYDLSGRPTTAVGVSTATLTAQVPATGVSATKTFTYSVSAETFSFSSPTLDFTQNVPITPVQIEVSTLSENPVIRFSSPNIPALLQITNTGSITGTLQGGTSGSFDVTAFTAYSSGSNPYSYTVTPDRVLLQPSVYTTVTAPGCNVSIPITGYSLSALTVSNYRFQSAFPYGLTVNTTSGLLSGTLATSLPSSTTFTVLGSAGVVNGSLVGTMTTNNLTVNRAQILRNDWANYFPDVSTLFVYSSDDNGSSWTSRYQAKNSLYASTIATNGSNVYLLPTSSNFVLKSTDTVTFSSNVYEASSNSPHATSIVNKPGTSTWWMVGTKLDALSARKTFLWTTSNDGVTWTSNEITGTGFTARDKHSNSAPWSPYITGGAALAYKDGVLLVGGTCILRSTDEGQTWSSVTGGFTTEVGFFSLDHPVVWVATGSDTYETISNASWTGTTAKTICYSLDAGLSWTYANNGFNMNGYGVVYAADAWMAYGLCNVYPSYSLYTMVSFDGVNWETVAGVGVAPGSNAGGFRPDALRMTIAYDETDWKVFVPTSDTTVMLYTHASDTPLLTGWTSTNISSSFPNFGSNSILTSYTAQLIDPGADVTTITFPPPTIGPTFISPAQTTYVVWQYMPIPKITFAATGTAPISYFIAQLPTGLTWNSTTQSVTGSCVRTGTQTLTVYAVDGDGGVTTFSITFICEIPRIVKRQTGAGAYTALVRDYTEVLAAINARDTRVLPEESVALGSFAAPYPPDVQTPSNCPC